MVGLVHQHEHPCQGVAPPVTGKAVHTALTRACLQGLATAGFWGGLSKTVGTSLAAQRVKRPPVTRETCV